jgi:hypothetical protein
LENGAFSRRHSHVSKVDRLQHRPRREDCRKQVAEEHKISEPFGLKLVAIRKDL